MSSFLGGGGGGRTAVTADTNFYVSTTGSDSNNGLTPATAFATLQHAFDAVASLYDFSGHQAIVNALPGTYPGFQLVQYPVNCAQLNFFGDLSSNASFANVTVNDTNAGEVFGSYACISLECVTPGVLNIVHMTLNVTKAGNEAVYVDASNSNVAINNNNPAPITPTLAIANISGGTGGTVFGAGLNGATCELSNNVTVSGNWQNFVLNQDTGFAYDPGGTITMVGTPDFSQGVINCQNRSNFQFTVPGVSFSGAATGQRFKLTGGSTISGFNPGDLGPNFIPGNVAGTCDATSSYDGFPGPLPGIDTQTVNYTLAIGDAFGRVEMNLAGANTLTVPANATVAFEIGTKITVVQTGAGATTVAAAAGVTVRNAGALAGQYASAVLFKRDTNEWLQLNGAF